jgi:hypothetical protein
MAGRGGVRSTLDDMMQELRYYVAGSLDRTAAMILRVLNQDSKRGADIGEPVDASQRSPRLDREGRMHEWRGRA